MAKEVDGFVAGLGKVIDDALEEAHRKGEAIGMTKTMTGVAIRLFAKGLSYAFVREVTGLEEDLLARLQQEAAAQSSDEH